MNKVTKFAAAFTALAAFAGSVSAQSFAIAVENGQLLDINGQAVSFGGANVFYSIVDASFDLTPTTDAVLPEDLEQLRPLSYVDMVDGTPIGTAWMTAGAEIGTFNPINVGEKVVVVFTDAPNVGAIAGGNQVGVGELAPFLSNLDNRFASVGTGTVLPVIGVPGSIGMVPVVPEPSTYALIGGLLALGFVAYRRRR